MNSLKDFRNTFMLMLVAVVATTLFTSCEKDEDKHVPPDVEFKTGSGYTSGDATVGLNQSILVGIIADKTEDELKTFNVSYAYDGATTTTTYLNETLSGAQEEHYEKDVTFTTRNQAGTEKWSFTVTDRDGNITTISMTLTVQ